MKPLHLIVVDDNSANRILPGLILRRLGHSVHECDSSAQALALLQATPAAFTHVLLDISMPALSGIEVCRRLRADARHQDLCIIAYTAHAMLHEQTAILDAGFDAMLIKPVRQADLLRALGLPPSATSPLR